MQEAYILSLGQEDPLEEGMATLSSILAWERPWTEEPGGLQSMGLQESDMTYWLNHQMKCIHRKNVDAVGILFKQSEWKLLSHVRLFATPWTLQSMDFSRPEYWTG